MHYEWDNTFVKKLARGKNPKAFAEELRSKYSNEIDGWMSGNSLEWANDSNRMARSVAYGMLPGFTCEETYLYVEKLPKSYKDASDDIVQKRLTMGGARIA